MSAILRLHSVSWEPSRLKQLGKLAEIFRCPQQDLSVLLVSDKDIGTTQDQELLGLVSLLSERGSPLGPSDLAF